LASVKDKTSGYFLLRREIIPFTKIAIDGFMQKVMLEIVVKSGSKRVVEVPFTFVNRTAGKSKSSMKEIRAYLRHLGRLYWYKMFG
jgi:dolichol-phosphate mannosyltransferase